MEAMMKKKISFLFLLCLFVGFFIFGEDIEQEEVGFLLFKPNLSNSFVNEAQAHAQLDTLAKSFLSKNILPGQIHIQGYAATAQNDIDSVNISKSRAVFIMNELQKRGVPRELFAEPVGYGSVNTWGNNVSEDAKKLNRRVRIFLDNSLPKVTVPVIDVPDTKIAVTDSVQKEPIVQNYQRAGNFIFPWWLFIGLLIFAAIAIKYWSLRKKGEVKTAEGRKLNINLPFETIAAFQKNGFSMERIAEISKRIGGTKDDTTFIPSKNDKEFDGICDANISYILNRSEDEKWGNLVDPARREMLIRNYQLLKDRKKGFIYKNGKFLGNMDDYAFRKATVGDICLQSIPAWRYSSGDKDNDPSGRGRLGITGLGNILFANQNGLVPEVELIQLRMLCPQVYNDSSPCSDAVLSDFKELTDAIITRIPYGSYTKNMMQVHEDHDMRTLLLVPAALHSTLPEHSNWRKLIHTGGQELVKAASDI